MELTGDLKKQVEKAETKGKLGDYLTVYLEMHDSHHREESFQNRMKMYYSRLKELNL